jgi:hypothetical protein
MKNEGYVRRAVHLMFLDLNRIRDVRYISN